MLERDIEKYLVAQCARRGILCEKFASANKRAVPDRILTYAGRVVFLELKAPGRKPSPAQTRDHYLRMSFGAEACWTDSKEGVDWIVSCLRMQRTIPIDSETFKVLAHGD